RPVRGGPRPALPGGLSRSLPQLCHLWQNWCRSPMMPRLLLFGILLFVPLFSLLCGGCSLGRQQPQTRLYVLTALLATDQASQVATSHSDPIGVGPVTLPQYTNRLQIVTGNTGQELRRAPFDNWAEPLENNFARVLAENLSLLLATDQVVIFPWQGP